MVGGLFGCLLDVGAIQGLTRFTHRQALVAPHYVAVSLLIS